jgi:hypothetical protein
VIRSETRDGAELVRFMLSVLRDEIGGVSVRDRIAAASWLTDHAFGRAPQALAVIAHSTADKDPEQVSLALGRMSVEALRELREAFQHPEQLIEARVPPESD